MDFEKQPVFLKKMEKHLEICNRYIYIIGSNREFSRLLKTENMRIFFQQNEVKNEEEKNRVH